MNNGLCLELNTVYREVNIVGKFSAKDMFQHARDIEDQGEKFYQALSQSVEPGPLQKIFLTMAKEEHKHRETYQAFLDKFEAGGDHRDTIAAGEDDRDYEELKDRIFNRMENVKKVHRLKTISDVLNYLIDIECDVVDLFEKLQNLVHTEDRPAITRIINEERSHVKDLTALRTQYHTKNW
jgi:rubrerythrin